MITIQEKKHCGQFNTTTMLQWAGRGRSAILPISPEVAFQSLPAPPGRAQVVALLAWAVQTAEEHGILQVVKQTAVRASFLAAVRVAEVFLAREEEPTMGAPLELEGTPSESWSGKRREAPLVVSPHPRKQKLGRLRLWRSCRGQGLGQPMRAAQRSAPMLAQPMENSCCFDGHQWMLRWAGETVRQRNLKGWRYIAFLLQHPGEEVHVLDLLALTDAQPLPSRAGVTGVSAAQLATQGLRTTRELEEHPSCDAAARTAYRLRLRELEEQELEAAQDNDTFRLAAVHTEREFLLSEIAEGYGYRAHARAGGDTAEKARKAVTNRIRDALARVQHGHPALWQHLFTSLQTGTWCAYRPVAPVKWIWVEEKK